MHYTREHARVGTMAHADQQPQRDWRQRLPQEWRSRVQPPTSFRVHRDEELGAERSFGYGRSGKPCYYSHHFRITELCSDDDEEFYLHTLYGETLDAWLLLDGRWLVCRQLDNDEQGEGRLFYSFSKQMPG